MSAGVERGGIAAVQGSETSAADSRKCSALNGRAGQEFHHRTAAARGYVCSLIDERHAAGQFQDSAAGRFKESLIGHSGWVHFQRAP